MYQWERTLQDESVYFGAVAPGRQGCSATRDRVYSSACLTSGLAAS
jgi:hypothetical protein